LIFYSADRDAQDGRHDDQEKQENNPYRKHLPPRPADVRITSLESISSRKTLADRENCAQGKRYRKKYSGDKKNKKPKHDEDAGENHNHKHLWDKSRRRTRHPRIQN